MCSKHLVLLRFQQVNELQTRAEVSRHANKSPGQRKRWRQRVGLCAGGPRGGCLEKNLAGVQREARKLPNPHLSAPRVNRGKIPRT